MNEAKQASVQGLTVEGRDGVSDCFPKLFAGPLAPPAVERIADKRVAQLCEMDPDLVCSAGFEAAVDEACKGGGRVAEAFQDLVVGAGVLAA